MKPLNCSTLLLICLLVILSSSCQNRKPAPPAELSEIDLKRGDILLCGTGEFGDVSWSLSCNYETREDFDLALALLHSFEYAEAEKAFVNVIDKDPECSMAYWGVAMSIYHSLWAPPSKEELAKGSAMLAIANSLPNGEKEERYLDAIGTYYKDWETVNHKTRAKNYETKMEEMYLSQKDDIEAAVFYALALNSTAPKSDKTYTNQRKAGDILESLFKDQPNHPGIAHYIIHTYDNPELAHMALPTARKYANIAPSSAHAQHMPSHIFTRLGLWDESIVSNIKSADAAVCYAEAANMDGHWAQEIHAIDYLVYAYLQQGNNAKAEEQRDYLATMFNINPAAMFAIAYPFAAVPARIALENKRWKEAANIEPHKSELEWEKFPWQYAIVHFTRALGAARSNDVTAAESELLKLQALEIQLEKMNDEYKSTQVKVQVKTIEAWIAFAKGDFDNAIAMMKVAADMEDSSGKHPVTPGEVLPARELLGDMLFLSGNLEDAQVAYEKNLKDRPNRFNGLYAAAVVADQLWEKEKASEYFGALLGLSELSNSNRPEIAEALEFINSKLPGNRPSN